MMILTWGVQRIGSRGATADFARSLCALLSPTLLPAATVSSLLELVPDLMQEDGNADFRTATLQLLVATAEAAPSLYGRQGPQVGTAHHSSIILCFCSKLMTRCLFSKPQALINCIQVLAMLRSEDAAVARTATSILAAAGAAIRAGSDAAASAGDESAVRADMEDTASVLTHLMAAGPYKASKAAAK